MTPDPDQPSLAPVARRAVLAAGLALGAAGCAAPGPGRTPSSGTSTGSPTGRTGTGPSPTDATTAGAAAAASPTAPAGPPRIARTAGPDVTSGPRDLEEVALTFHGQGTREVTTAVLEAARSASTRLTVFAVGTWVRDDPSQVRALAAAGHEIGNHTWSHQQMPALDAATARSEVVRGRDAVATALGAAGWWFRPSGTRRSTATIRAAAAAAGYARCISYDVDPEDYLDPGAALVRKRTRAAVRPGSIVSLHLGHAGTAEALPGILADLHRLGLAPVTLSTLLRDRETP